MSATKPIKDHPAFPVEPHPGDENTKPIRGNSGMSMLDYFAGQAVAGLSATDSSSKEIAELSFDIAEEMMTERTSRYISNR
jgi:hypothetical protein